MKFDYSFAVWPLEGHWDHAVYRLFAGQPRQVHTFTEDEWGQFRASIERSGFTLREVERVPHHEPEAVR